MQRAGVLVILPLLQCASAGRAPETFLGDDASQPAGPVAGLADHRQLQVVSPGALDADICSATVPASISNEVGTLHDDQTDTEIDCSQGGCGGLDTGSNGYGDNLDCGKALVAPAGWTIELTFTHIALEMSAGCTGGPTNGCDYVTVYDGPSSSAPILGQFTGTDIPADVESTGNSVYVVFHTDGGNAGLSNVASDPGFYLDWHFVQHITGNIAGDGICPVAGLLTASHGTLHDDERGNVDCSASHACHSTGDCSIGYTSGSCTAGYADSAHCFTTIQAPDDTQVIFTFTQLNLELTGCHPERPNGGCPDGGCDYVAVYDGADSNAPLLGKFSGQPPAAAMPQVVSSGTALYIEFISDIGNIGIGCAGQTGDPGWFADWDFLENGQDICHPETAVLTDSSGILHDDGQDGAVDCSSTACGGADTTGAINGYADNLDCGVRIRGGRGSTVNLHFTAMNIESATHGSCADPATRQSWCGCDVATDANCVDYVAIYDGPNENSPLIARVSGEITDEINQHDTFTSTGRNMFVKFHTDSGNYGLQGTFGDPGFYAQWQIIEDGQACDHFVRIADTAIRGHNNERFDGVTVEECEELCCARDWCKSFDYTTNEPMHCNLADVDATRNFGDVTRAGNWDLYEKPNGVGTAAMPLGAAGCQSMLASISDDVNNVCCGSNGADCHGGAPRTCTEECASLWMPFAKQCSQWLSENTPDSNLMDVTTHCEIEQYGRYKPNKARGRCNDDDLQEFFNQLSPACCGPDGAMCADLARAGVDAASGVITLATPMLSGQLYCSAECSEVFEEFYAECHPRIEHFAPDAPIDAFLRVCQGLTATGDGHRRMKDGGEEDV